MSLVDSYFYPYRVTGKNWTSLPEVAQFLREYIINSPEQILIDKDISVLLIDESDLLIKITPIVKKYGFRSIKPTDLQQMLREMGVTGYITSNKDIILLESYSS